jgi:hypothetical protein
MSTNRQAGAWRKSSYSGNSANCVEVALETDGSVAVRDSKDRAGHVLSFLHGEWGGFLEGVKDGEFE